MVEDAFVVRRERLELAAQTPRTQKEIEDELKKKIKGRKPDLVCDDRTWTVHFDFDAMVSDPNNNKKKVLQEAILGTSGSLNMPLSDIVKSVEWLQAQVNSVRTGNLGGQVVRRG